MIKFFILLVLLYSIDIILVGLSFSAIKKAFKINISSIYSLIILIIIFAVINNDINPIISMLNLTFTVHNKEIAEFFKLKPNESTSALLSIGYSDFIIWFVESIIALFVVDKQISKKLRAI